MQAEIITIGDEILIGQVVDTNSAWIAQQLNKLGVAVSQITSIQDNPDQLVSALDDASGRADLIIITGGLGPTKDDKTKATLCKYFDGKMIINSDSLEHIKSIFNRYNRPMLDVNLQQAQVPDSCKVLLNEQGTAPGMWFEKLGKVYISLPGVPFEMKDIFSKKGIPAISNYFGVRLQKIYHKTLISVGLGESFLAEQIAEIEDNLPPHIKLAYLPNLGMVRLRLSGLGKDYEKLKAEVDEISDQIVQRIGTDVISEEDLPLAEIVINKLRIAGASLSTAESCTGGYIAHLLTSIPGSSEVFKGAIVSYSNQTKVDLLGVQKDTLATHGAVSQQTVEEMATGALRKMDTDYSIACSGIAGPSGGTAEKPVGTVWVAIADKNRVFSQEYHFRNGRAQNIERTAVAAFTLLLRFVSLNH